MVKRQHVISLIIILFFSTLALLSSCKSAKSLTSAKEYPPISVQEWIQDPFGFPATLSAFRQHMPGAKEMKMLHRAEKQPNLVDTIYDLKMRGGTEAMFLYTYKNEHIFIGAHVEGNHFHLKNGIAPGMTESQLRARLTGLPPIENGMIEYIDMDAPVYVRFQFNKKGVLDIINVITNTFRKPLSKDQIDAMMIVL